MAKNWVNSFQFAIYELWWIKRKFESRSYLIEIKEFVIGKKTNFESKRK